MRLETQTMVDVTGGSGPHAGQPIAVAGAPLAHAAGTLILLHGRGGSAAEMLGLAELVGPPQTAWLAPQAAGHTWYPHRFIEPTEVNEPYLGSALSAVGDVVDRVAAAGVAPRQIALVGFSQGACLALEFARRSAQRLGAVIGLSGGLIGERITPPSGGSRPFEGMPVLLGCSERDPHIPIGRVRETDAIMRALGAEVATRIYPGTSHGMNQDEVYIARRTLASMVDVAPRAA